MTVAPKNARMTATTVDAVLVTPRPLNASADSHILGILASSRNAHTIVVTLVFATSGLASVLV